MKLHFCRNLFIEKTLNISLLPPENMSLQAVAWQMQGNVCSAGSASRTRLSADESVDVALS
jgi:hypothetical protein